MCMGCINADFEQDEIEAAKRCPEVLRIRDLVKEFYTLPGCFTGGPLHITTDDTNIEDSHLDFCESECRNPWGGKDMSPQWDTWDKTPERDEIAEKGLAIIAALRPLSECERALAADGQYW